MKFLLAMLAFLAPAAAMAATGVTLQSEVFVEKSEAGPDGKPRTVLQPPKVVVPGDRLVFVISYRNGGADAATGFVLTNPIPDAVAFAGSDSDGSDVSIDGGKSWGQLAALSVKEADGTSRPAAPADVTHVRWRFARAIPAGGDGQIQFRGTVK